MQLLHVAVYAKNYVVTNSRKTGDQLTLHIVQPRKLYSLSLSILEHSRQKLKLTIASCKNCYITMVAAEICHVKARLVDLIGSPGIKNAMSAKPEILACAPRLSPLPFFLGEWLG